MGRKKGSLNKIKKESLEVIEDFQNSNQLFEEKEIGCLTKGNYEIMYLIQNVLTIEENYEKNSDTHIMVITDKVTQKDRTVFLSLDLEIKTNELFISKEFTTQELMKAYKFACADPSSVFNGFLNIREYAQSLKQNRLRFIKTLYFIFQAICNNTGQNPVFF